MVATQRTRTSRQAAEGVKVFVVQDSSLGVVESLIF